MRADEAGALVDEYGSIRAAARAAGVDHRQIGRALYGPDWGRGSSASSSGVGGNYRAAEWTGQGEELEAGEWSPADYVSIILAGATVAMLALEAWRWWRRRHPLDGDQ